MILGLTQKEAGRQLGVTSSTVLNWEQGDKPAVRHWPAILAFLGYDPRPGAASLTEHLTARRQDLGWSQQIAAVHLGVDPSTWSSWENGGTIMLKEHREAVARFLGLPESKLSASMGERWGQAHRKNR